MTNSSNIFAVYAMRQRTRNLLTTLLVGTFVAAQVTPSLATIDNTANAVGTYGGATAAYGTSSLMVPVAPATAAMTISKTTTGPTQALGADPAHTDAGDNITYTYVVTNTGTYSINAAQPQDGGPQFSGIGGTATLAAFVFQSSTGTASPGAPNPFGATENLAPGATATFTAVYTLTTLDVYHGAGAPGSNFVVNIAAATGTYGPSNTVYNMPTASKSTVKTTILANPALAINKTKVLIKKPGNGAAGAELGDTIKYSYAVANVGNVAMTNVSVTDMHGTPALVVPVGGTGITGEAITTVGAQGAGASTDTTANDGIWSSLAAGDTVTFTWTHIVNQAEVDHG